MKKRFSFKAFGRALKQMTYRFPIAVGLLTVLTVLLSLLFTDTLSSNNSYVTVVIWLTVGIVLDFALSLWGEEQSSRKHYWTVKGSILAAWTIYCVVLLAIQYDWEHSSIPFIVGNGAWFVAVLLAIPFVSFLREKDDIKAWHFMMNRNRALLLSFVIALFMLGGLLGLLYGTVALFSLPHKGGTIPIVLSVVCMVLIFGVLFFSLIPAGENKHNTSTDISKFLRNTVTWLFLPLLCGYMLLLYIYSINILITWSLPEGLISYLVSAVMAVYLLCYFLLYPQIKVGGTWQTKVLTRWLPIAILPLLVLMTVAVAVRISTYSITAPRLYLLTILAWLYAVCIVILVRKTPRFRWIFLSFAAVFLLSSGQPLNYYFVCKHVIIHQVDKFIAERNLPVPIHYTDLYWTTEEQRMAKGINLTDEDKHWFVSRIDYLDDVYDYNRTRYYYFGGDSLDNQETDDEEYTPIPVYLRNINYSYSGTMNCPRGKYELFRNTYADYTESRMDSIRNGILPIYNKYCETTLLFDTAAIKYSYNHDLPMIIPSRDNKAAFVPKTITIRIYSDSTLNIDYSGYIFYN